MTESTPNSKAGSTSDPNQADKTGLPQRSGKPKVDLEVPHESDTDQPTGPGTTLDPNQADRT